MAFAIVINEKGGQPRRQEFLKGEITIGRVQGNDIVLPKQNVSKRHSRVVLKNGKFVITDLKSTNGTYVNGRKITTPMVIKETDKIYIGDFVLSAELVDQPSEGASAPGATPPPPPPTSSLPGARPPFPGGMPAKTIASGVSPFAQEMRSAPAPSPTPAPSASSPAAGFSPMTEIAPPPPQAQPAAPPAPPKPAASSVGASPFGGQQAPSAPEPAAPKQEEATEQPPAQSSPFGGASPSPFGSAPQNPLSVAEAAKPALAAPAQAASLQASSAHAGPFPSASGPLGHLANLKAASASPSFVDLDASVYAGEETSAQLITAHQALADGLHSRGLTSPTRYRPGQRLNPALIDAAYEVFKELKLDRQENVIETVMNEAFGVGALQPLIEDEKVSEIYLNGAFQLSYVVDRSRTQEKINDPFSSMEQAVRAAQRILHGLGRDGERHGEGTFGPFRAYVDLDGAQGPYVCLQRVVMASSLGEAGHQISELIKRGGKVVVAASKSHAQASFAAGLAELCFSGQRLGLLGVSQHIGGEAEWFTLSSSDDALDQLYGMNATGVVIADQPSLTGEKVFEALSTTSSGILLLTARDTQSAIAKIRRRAGDDQLVLESVDAVLFVSSDTASLEEVYHIAQGQTIYANGAWSGQLI